LFPALLSFATFGFSDMFYLSDGRVMTGKIAGEKNGIVRLRTTRGDLRIHSVEILKIELERPGAESGAPAEKTELTSQGIRDYIEWRMDLRTGRTTLFASACGIALGAVGLIVAGGMPDKKSDPFARPTKNQMTTAAILCAGLSSAAAIWAINSQVLLTKKGREKGYIARLSLSPLFPTWDGLSGFAISLGFSY
jgi:hypothetical protein